jgi:hypothetical protein
MTDRALPMAFLVAAAFASSLLWLQAMLSALPAP